MKKRDFTEMTSILTNLIMKTSTVFEWVISVTILLAVGVSLIDILTRFDVFSLDFSTVKLDEMLPLFLNLVVGLEFIKMIMIHSHGAILEVLMFATARQLILDHSIQGHLLGVVAIAGLFAIWRFLYDKNEEQAHLRRLLEKIREKDEKQVPLTRDEKDTLKIIEKSGALRDHAHHHR
ncbi:MAG: hypothetical protein IIX88_04120 [Firmicutes bacterium]|nr:hypothetical protein [Bacillota bacterium]MBQ2270603.1 hypothetical protein [Bacillota bacterium]MBQ5797118.1 hypothetical protein [Bacillota bacterium]MBR5000343.1 hypothetical protein [Bacillota bacterium]